MNSMLKKVHKGIADSDSESSSSSSSSGSIKEDKRKSKSVSEKRNKKEKKDKKKHKASSSSESEEKDTERSQQIKILQSKRQKTEEVSERKTDEWQPPKRNEWTGLPFSQKYFEILEKRKELPAWAARHQVIELVRKYQVIILQGETGSGKTTQVPQFLLEAGLAGKKNIACTQPRRVAAMSVAKRVSEEMDVALGTTVGYTIRFEDKSSQQTRLKYLTDGMLLRESMMDPMLSKYSIIVLDEAHERTLSTDILFGLLKEILPKRPDLKVVVMSATLNAERFQQYFEGSPLIDVPGRMFDVEIFYTDQPEKDYYQAVIRTVLQIHTKEAPGDILVFLTGEEEIENACAEIREEVKKLGNTCGEAYVLPLYSTLPPQQ